MSYVLSSQTDLNPPGNLYINNLSFSPVSSLLIKFHKLIILTFFLLMGTASLNGQILNDSNSVTLIKKSVDFVYNFKFDNADKVNQELIKLYPGHPLNYLLKGMITYWKNYPLITTSEQRESFESDMRQCINICDKIKKPSNEAEILLVNLCARGFLLLFYTDNDLSFEVFPIASSTYQCIRRSFEFTAGYLDLFFFTGIYNYYREAYPEAHPVYKTLAFLFPKGNKIKGLNDLQIVAMNSILLKAEAYAFLTDIYLYFENNFSKATSYSKNLHVIYPDNPRYLGTYIKNLLLIKHYDEAEKELQSASSINNSFLQVQMTIFKGIIQEKKYHNLKLAEQLYSDGIRRISGFRTFGEEYAAYAYFGLSRISEKKGNITDQKNYRKLALKLSVFKNIDFSD
jgi:tetratricopeptide (TPR) repeat protein